MRTNRTDHQPGAFPLRARAYRGDVALFADRTDAGRVLSAELEPFRGTDAVVFGIPRGGVVVAAAAASAVDLEVRAFVVRKLGAPSREEFAVGAIADGVRVVDDDALRRTGATPEELAATEGRERLELERRTRLFAAADTDVAGRVAIVVDDGVATGATATAACRALRLRDPARVVLAVPVAPARWRPDPAAVDDYVCPHRMRDFWAVGQYYADFTQTEDDEVVRLLGG